MFGEMDYYDAEFDFNGDGHLDSVEFAAIDEEEFERRKTSGTIEDDLELDLLIAGLDEDDLELMDEQERIEVLEEAGLDPDDYDFL